MIDGLLKCENVKLLIDGSEFGGVTVVKSVRKNELTEIGSFLSDVPVYESIESSYELKLELDVGKSCPFTESDRLLEITICCDDKKVKYSECVIKNMQTVIKPKGRIAAEITFVARERTVL
ncbi:MAG: hypothetical protein J1E85_06855 [Ruminococcus sp.]|nr:hypothetical protein [Ruminococcus sp.]